MITVADDSPGDLSAPGVYQVGPGVYRKTDAAAGGESAAGGEHVRPCRGHRRYCRTSRRRSGSSPLRSTTPARLSRFDCARIDEFIAHHKRRLERTADLVAGGARTAYEVAGGPALDALRAAAGGAGHFQQDACCARDGGLPGHARRTRAARHDHAQIRRQLRGGRTGILPRAGGFRVTRRSREG
jgi:hypothetical protein